MAHIYMKKKMHKNINLWREAIVCSCTVLCLLVGLSGVFLLARIKVMADDQKKNESLIPVKDN